jgi:hypothetical protein
MALVITPPAIEVTLPTLVPKPGTSACEVKEAEFHVLLPRMMLEKVFIPPMVWSPTV